MSPTQKSLRLLRELGYTAEDVTAYGHPASAKWPRKKDVLGFADILAFRGVELLAVNATDKTSVAKHKTKYTQLQTLHLWLATGSGFAIHGWDPEADEEARVVSAFLTDDGLMWG